MSAKNNPVTTALRERARHWRAKRTNTNVGLIIWALTNQHFSPQELIALLSEIYGKEATDNFTETVLTYPAVKSYTTYAKEFFDVLGAREEFRNKSQSDLDRISKLLREIALLKVAEHLKASPPRTEDALKLLTVCCNHSDKPTSVE